MAKLVDALDLGSSGETLESSSLSFRTILSFIFLTWGNVMEVSVENTSTLGRKVKVSVPDAKVSEQFKQRISKFAKEAHLKGFRPGKIPQQVIEKRFGESLRLEVIEALIRESLTDVFEKNALQVAGTPRIEEIKNESGQALEFTAVLEVYPEIHLTDLNNIEFEKRQVTILDEDVNKMIEKLKDNFGEGKSDEKEPLTEEALANKLGINQTEGETLFSQVKERMQAELDSTLREEIKEKVLEVLLEKNPIELPRALIDQEKEAIRRELSRQNKVELPKEAMEQPEIENQAKRRVELGLLLNEVIKKYQVKAEPALIMQEINKIADRFPGQREQVINVYRQNKDLLHTVERMVLLDRAVDVMLGEMKPKEVTVSFDQVMNSTGKE